MTRRTNRRSFLRTGMAGAAGLGLVRPTAGEEDGQIDAPLWDAPSSLTAPEPPEAIRCVRRQGVPVLARAEVLIVGSSLQGCFLAERLARRGRRVVVVSPDTSLPCELAIGLRPWIKRSHLERAPEDIHQFLMACRRQAVGDEWILNMVAVTTGLEDRLLDAAVHLYYDLQPCGVELADDRSITGALFAGKGGLFGIAAQCVVDCTPDARVAKWAGGVPVLRKAAELGVLARYSMWGLRPPETNSLVIDAVPELRDGRVLVHGDFLEFRARLPVTRSWEDESFQNLEMRRIAAKAGRALKQSGVWSQAAFVRGGDRILVDPSERVKGRGSGEGLEVDACRPPEVANLLVCSPSADVADDLAAALVEPLAGPCLADVLEDAPWDTWCRTPVKGARTLTLGCGHPPQLSADQEVRFEEIRPLYATDQSMPITGVRLPVVAECDVLVVGAGTSGAPAGTLAASEGADTLVVDKYADVGGTHTIGGVPHYWYGRRTEFVTRLDRQAAAMMDATGMPKCLGMLNTLLKAGARLLRGMAAGTVVQGKQVVGAVFATPAGLVAIRARHVIDASGDGDLAAWAGAEADYGTCHDAQTMWDNFSHYRGTNPEAARHFDCTYDLRDPADLTRGIISSRRRGGGRDAQGFPQYYLTPRESRHIRGRATVTYQGILGRQRFRDIVLVALSNFDIKGIACSDLIFSGYVDGDYSRNHPAPIPYRALVPRDWEGLLVVGKAWSCTHDALSLARMQRDIMAMGGVAGLAAAQALATGCELSAIDIDRLQATLVEAGILNREDITSDRLESRVSNSRAGGVVYGDAEGPAVVDQQWPRLSDAQLQQLVARLARDDLTVERMTEILVRPDAALPRLKEALDDDQAAGQVEVARALAFLGDQHGAEILLAELQQQLAGDTLPAWEHRRHMMPDHGWAPPLTHLVFLLARLEDRRVIPLMHRIAGQVQMNPARSDAMFCYVHAVCLAAEQLAIPECVETLELLAQKPEIADSDLPSGTDPRRTVDPTADRYAYLELCVGRALDCCGAPRGREILARYADDLRGVLARSARAYLAEQG